MKFPTASILSKKLRLPQAYILSEEGYLMTISEDGEIVGITAENKPITIEISKQDVYGEELSGAEMELINSDEETVEKWTSDGYKPCCYGASCGDIAEKKSLHRTVM